MQVTETLSDGLKRAYSVVLPAADIESRRTERLANLSKTLRLPGFRPGKVPMPVVRQRFGTAVSAEILEETVNDAMRQVLNDRGLRPALQPKIDITSEQKTNVTANQDLAFNVELEILPDIAMPDFSGVELTRPTAAVSDEAVDEVLANIAKARRELAELTDEDKAERGGNGAAKTGDVLTVDFVGKVDGVAFEGGTANDVDVDLGGEGFIPGFAEQMEGMAEGDQKTISVTFPENYGNAELAGKAATFDVTAKKVRKPVVAEINDDLAMKMGYDTLDEVKTDIRARRQREYDSMSRMRIKRQLLDKLADMVSFPVPQGMLDAEFDQIWQRLDADRKAGRIDEDDKDKDEDTLKSEYRAIAERRVRLGLLLAEIGRTNNIVVSEDELTRAMRQEVSRYPGQEQMMLDLFRKYPALVDNLRGPLFEDKVVDYVLDQAKVTDQVMTPEELAQEPDAPAAASEAPAEG